MRCFVTGASGFLGSWLVRELLKEGHSVTVWMRSAALTARNSDWVGKVRIVQGSFEDIAGLRTEIHEDSIDCFFHLAWCGVAAEERNSGCQISANVAGSMQLWEIASKAGCKHWIAAGSQAEYGPHDGLLDEIMPANPVTAYGLAKHASATLTRKMSEMSGMRHTWVRLLAAYGPGDDCRHLIPAVIHALSSGVSPSLTRGEQLWDYLYVADAARAFCSIANTGAVGTFNLCSGETVQIRNLVERIRDMIDQRVSLKFGSIAYRPDQLMRVTADPARLRSATGWQPEHSLHQGLLSTVEWFKGSADASIDR